MRESNTQQPKKCPTVFSLLGSGSVLAGLGVRSCGLVCPNSRKVDEIDRTSEHFFSIQEP